MDVNIVMAQVLNPMTMMMITDFPISLNNVCLLRHAFKLAEEAFSYLDHVVVTDKRDDLTNISYAVLSAVAFEDAEKVHFFNSKIHHISIPFCFLASLVSGFFISMALWRKLRKAASISLNPPDIVFLSLVVKV